MTKMEIEKRIDTLENNKFFLAMKDHWNREDFDYDAKLWKEICELKKELQKLN